MAALGQNLTSDTRPAYVIFGPKSRPKRWAKFRSVTGRMLT